MGTGLRENTEAQITGLDTRVTGLETGMDRIISTLDKITAKIDSAQKTPWVTLAAFGTLAIVVLGGFNKLAYDPIKDTQLRQVQIMDQLVMREDQRWSEAGRDKVTVSDSIRAATVPRAEYEARERTHEHWLERIEADLVRLQNGQHARPN